MLLGPSLSAIFLTWIAGDKPGLRDLFSKLFRARIPARWYAPLLIPPVLVLILLLTLKTFVSPVYAPNLFLMGVWFGVPAGLLEEIRLDWLRLSQNASSPTQSARREYTARTALGLVALAGHKLPRNRYAPRCILVPVLPGLHFRHDRHACFNFLALRQHKKCPDRSAHAHKLNRLLGHLLPSRCLRQPGSPVVRTLRCRVMARRSDHSKEIRHQPGVLTALQNRLDGDSWSRFAWFFLPVMFWRVVIRELPDRVVRRTNKPDTLFSHARL